MERHKKFQSPSKVPKPQNNLERTEEENNSTIKENDIFFNMKIPSSNINTDISTLCQMGLGTSGISRLSNVSRTIDGKVDTNSKCDQAATDYSPNHAHREKMPTEKDGINVKQLSNQTNTHEKYEIKKKRQYK